MSIALNFFCHDFQQLRKRLYSIFVYVNCCYLKARLCCVYFKSIPIFYILTVQMKHCFRIVCWTVFSNFFICFSSEKKSNNYSYCLNWYYLKRTWNYSHMNNFMEKRIKYPIALGRGNRINEFLLWTVYIIYRIHVEGKP